ncbi:MarR family transcriptional regulator [Haloterrigena sp. SYSU A558-1]|uniref:MarR family transcriptional regulator n=1 Tax=Haloterrigena gelatinilytica TaxID=2741724 RepID=A0ABX2LHV9_9EURY|nr:MarR family transcriptional regulator [Haloterrigena gelatinilytica]NUC75035.1 MarR family transcriptional regulator [Haloterrigena gelatinilytica]
MSKQQHVPLEADDLDSLDRAILDYLQEGRDEGEPWGIATPAVVRAALEDGDFGDVPVRQTINNRMRKLELAGHLRNRHDKGEYVFVSDPRDD